MKRCRTIAWAAGALAVAGPAGAETSDERTAASLGLQYDIAGGGAARAEPFAYPIVAVSSYGSWWLLDVRSPLIVGVIDAMAGATEYAFDGDGDFSLPIWRGLNGDREHVRIPAFTLDARVKLVQSGRERLDLGLHGEMVGTFFQVDGVRRNAHFINAGPALGYGLFEPDGSGAVILSASVGNGFGHRASTNPFAEGSLQAWRRFVSPVGAYARGQLGVQWIDYRPATTTTEAELDLIDPVAHGSASCTGTLPETGWGAVGPMVDGVDATTTIHRLRTTLTCRTSSKTSATLAAHGTMTEGFTFRGDEVPPSRRAPALQRYAAQICRSRPQGRTSLRHSSRSPSGRGSMRE